MRRGFWAAAAGFFAVLALAVAPAAASEARDLKVLGDPYAPVVAAQPSVAELGPTEYRFEMTLSQAVEFSSFVLTSPDRLVVDLPELDWGFRAGATADLSPRSAVRGVRNGLFRPGRSRLVIDLDRPVRRVDSEIVYDAPDRPARLVLSFETVATPLAAAPSAAALASSAVAPAQTALPATPAAVTVAPPSRRPASGRASAEIPPPPPRRPQRILVMLDPGHGGRDPGAVAGEVHEKDITLDFALRLRERLRRDGRFEVVMTRETDVFVPLEERVEKARAARAELFISLHADAAPNHPKLSGASVYTLSDKASDRLAEQLALGHGGGDGELGVQLPERSAIREIIVDFTKRRVNNRSEDFAEIVVSELRRRDVPVLKKRPHRQAAFVVLKSFSAPGALVELGFLTNILDRRRLTNPAWRDEAAEAVARAVRRWADPAAPVRLKASDR